MKPRAHTEPKMVALLCNHRPPSGKLLNTENIRLIKGNMTVYMPAIRDENTIHFVHFGSRKATLNNLVNN